MGWGDGGGIMGQNNVELLAKTGSFDVVFFYLVLGIGYIYIYMIYTCTYIQYICTYVQNVHIYIYTYGQSP